MKKLVFLFAFLSLSTGLFADAPQNSVNLTIQGGDPFAAPPSGSGGASIQSVGGGVGTSTSQLGSILGLSQNYFQTGDINLSQGAMQQSETDLSLPGINGLDFTIMRTYSSMKYRSEPNLNPTEQKLWGAYAGKGWSFNIGMRVYVVRSNDVKNADKVFLENSDGIEEYESGVSKQPGNFNRTTVITTGGKMDMISRVEFRTTNGMVFIFEKKFVQENYQKNNGAEQYKIEGYCLTRIENLQGQRLQYQYDDLGASSPIAGGLLASVIGSGNTEKLDQIGYSTQGMTAWYQKTRVSQVTDTFGRVITMGYGESSNQNTAVADQMLSSVTYTGIDGTLKKIVYSYKTDGCLTKVQVGNLPPKTYDYTAFSPRFRYLNLGWYEYPLGVKTWRHYAYKAAYDNTLSGDRYVQYEFDYLRGSLLTKITSPLGAMTTFQYEDCLVTTFNYGTDDNILPAGSTPTVIQKQIIADGITKTYTFNYPRNSYGYLSKTGVYRPAKQDTDSYYFTQVTVDNPSEMVDDSYVFERSMVIKHTQGINETQTFWDYDKLLKAKEINLKNGIIQSQTEYQYGAYYNPITVITKKGPSLTPILQQDTTYVTTSKTGAFNDLADKNLIHLAQTSMVTDLTSNISRSSHMQFNSNGQTIESYRGNSTAGKLLKTMGYDSQGRVIEERTPLSNGSWFTVTTTYYQYNQEGIYVVRKMVNGKSVRQQYELKTGQLTMSTDANSNQVRYLYDTYGRPITVLYPDDSQDTVAYSADLKTTTSTSGGITSIQTVDSLGRLILSQATGQEDVKIDYYFSNLPSKTYKKQNGVWILKGTTIYDQYLRKIQSISPDFGTSTIAYDTPGMNQITATDPLGRQTIQTMDEFGQTTQAQDTGGGLTKITYNGFGEAIQTIDSRGLIHKMGTDDYGKLVRSYYTKHQNTAGGLVMRSQPMYNSMAPSVIDSTTIYTKTGTVFRNYGYQYDNEGRLVQTSMGGQLQETLTYDETRSNSKDKLTRAETPDAITQYDFDEMGRITKETTTAKAINKTWDIQYVYNTNGQLVSLRYPDGKLVEYVYDLNQRLSQIKYNNQSVLTYTYNPNGTVASLVYGNGKTMSYTYQKEVLLSGINYNNGQYSQSYNFDTVGKITQTQHNDYVTYGSPLTRAYNYTQKDELKSMDLNGSRYYTHDFDKNSNLIRFETRNNRAFTGTNLTQPSQNMIIDVDSDQLLQKNHKNGGVIQVSYDPEGNMSRKKYVLPGNLVWTDRQYTYNYQGQLQTVSENGAIIADYGYDHKRQRIYSNTRLVDFPVKFYYWDQSGRVIGEGVHGKTDFSVRYIYNGNQKVAMERRDMNSGQIEMLYFVNNAQGTPVQIVDQNSNPVSRINMDEYGNPGIMFGPAAEVNFTGKKMDLKTDLYYFNQRYYDPELGRFLQEDPANQTFNLYQYCANNPLMYTDPDGRLFIFDDILIGMAIAAIQAGLSSAAINAAAQYVMTGSVNMQSVLNSFGSGALSGAMSFGIGGMMGHATEGLGKTLAHGVSGGLQSMANGGNFGSGFVGGAVGNMAGEASKGMDMWGQAGVAGLASGTTSWATGGDFATGFQAGAGNMLWNKNGEKLVNWAKDAVSTVTDYMPTIGTLKSFFYAGKDVKMAYDAGIKGIDINKRHSQLMEKLQNNGQNMTDSEMDELYKLEVLKRQAINNYSQQAVKAAISVDTLGTQQVVTQMGKVAKKR
jgi:RHS repeat-associated protein